MKLIRLEMLNLASLDNPDGEVIDFTRGALGESNIFSIVGPTGSGKSTLLDAICIALYNRAPRYPLQPRQQQRITIYGKADNDEKNRPAPTDCRNILTRGKKDAYSKLTFEANNGQVYRAEWSVHFKRKGHDRAVMKLFRIGQTDGKPTESEADWNELPQIIGLEYEQFLNTVLIAQGAFASFLSAKEDDRFELLEKLIGGDLLYGRIAGEVEAKSKAAQSRLEQINAAINADKQYVLADDALAQLDREIAELTKAQTELTQQLKKVENELAWWSDDARLANDIATCQQQAQQAQEAVAAFGQRAARLRLHDALAPATDILREVRRLEAAIESARRDIDATRLQIRQREERIAHESHKLEQLKADAQQAHTALDEAAPHLLRARELKTQMLGAKTTLTEKETAKTDAELAQEAAEKALTDNTKNSKLAMQALAEAQAQHQDTAQKLQKELDDLSMNVANAENILQAERSKLEGLNADHLLLQKSRADQAMLDLTKAIDALAKWDADAAELLKDQQRQDDLKRQNQQAQDELSRLNIEALKQEVETDTKAYTLITSEAWQQHRHLLADGKPCPLCGATVHPYHADEQQFDEVKSELRQLLENKQQDLKRRQDIERGHQDTIKRNEGELIAIGQRMQQLAGSIVRHQQDWETLHRQHTDWSRDKAALEGLRLTYEARQTDADAAVKDYNKLQRAIDRMIKDKELTVNLREKLEKEINQTITKLSEAVGARQTELYKLQALTPNLSQQLQDKQKALTDATAAWQQATNALAELKRLFDNELGGEQPDEFERRLKQRKDTADKAVSDQSEQLTRLQTELGSIRGSLQTQNDQLMPQVEQFKAGATQLDSWIESYNARSDRLKEVGLEDVDDMVRAGDDWEALRNKGQELTLRANSLKTLLDKAHETHRAHQASKPQLTQQQLARRQHELSQTDHLEPLLLAQSRRQRHNDALVGLGAKADELSQAQQLHDDWKAIDDAVGSRDGKLLRKIAQCYTLSFLIEHANAEIRKFNHRYELQQVKNSLGIRVIDHDRADDVRDTTSLSGGETFIVSLGLALGLSALSSRNISFDNLFIDEGFGTLDADTLGTVIDSLAMLQTSQGKKVGVISHTDTMSERITTQIRVIPNGSTGSSRIEIVP